jgi:hypothetical protein
MEATERRNYPCYIKLTYTPPKGNLGIFVVAPSDGCPATANFLSLDTSLAIPTCVLLFEVSGMRRRTPVRPVLLTSQTGLMLLPLVFSLGFVDQPSNSLVFW